MEVIPQFNSKPKIYFVRNEALHTEIKDTVKLNHKTFGWMPIELRIQDNNKDVMQLKYKITKGTGKVLYKDKEITEDNLLFSKYQNTLKFIPDQLGTTTITFTAKDNFKETNTITMTVQCMDNLPPIAKYKIEKIGTQKRLEYLIDASESIDPDQNVGGAIKEYRYTIDKQSIRSDKNQMKYALHRAGVYTVSLQVVDNEGAVSDPISTKLYVSKE